MKPLRVVLLIVGSLIALIGLGLLAAGASLGWAVSTQRDDTGYFTTPTERFATDSYALTSDKIDLGEPGPDAWWAEQEIATVRLRAENSDTGQLFIGIGPEADVESYLANVAHDDITNVKYRPFSAKYRRENGEATATPTAPGDQTFWVTKATGETEQTLTWNLQPGRWAIVVMNADATRAVSVDLELAAQVDYLVPLAIGLGVVGLILLLSGAALIVGGVVQPHAAALTQMTPMTPEWSAGGSLSPGRYPLRLEGRLDPQLSRWKWLIKWFLTIPHFIVLVFLWVAFGLLTLVAFFAILLTGSYPLRIFEFNVGVLRWSWRVCYYATSALATDQYPPFSLHRADYPAQLDVAYPERLSRGLVLVKSWLLALPHLVIVALLTASWGFNDNDDGRFLLSGGLLGVLMFVTAMILLFTGRYPRGLYDLIMGLNRWIYRVIAYVALMTDEYPPFHLDQGPTEPDASMIDR